MPEAKCSDSDFIRMFEEVGPHETTRKLGVSASSVFARRVRLEKKFGRQITPPEHYKNTRQNIEHPGRVSLDVETGIVVIAGDGHYWPGPPTTAHRALVKFIKEFKPVAVIKNGDAFDGASISRHPPIGWEKMPSVQEEIEATQERLGELEAAAGKARKIWPLGNHDSRFETRLATQAPEYAKVHGVHLRDHHPLWEPCWSCFINDDVVVKHRFKGGMHAPQNNTLWAGRTMFTNHLHSLKVQPITDYNGTRWGVDCGCIAEPLGPQFTDYSEDSPKNWRSGFAVATFHKGRLLWPEVVAVHDAEHVDFRGQLIRV